MSKKKTTEEFIKDAIKIHGDKHDYSLVEYNGNKIPVKIFCKKHSVFFQQRPNDHLSGHGCKLCANEKNSESKASSKEEFIKKAKLKFGDKFDYSEIEYKNERTEIKIICPKHGIKYITPIYHLISPKGCPDCGIEGKSNDASILQSKLSKIKNMSFSNIQENGSKSYEYLIDGICNMCGKKLTKTIRYFLYDFSCCQCQKPNDYFGEYETENFLIENNILYTRNKIFSDLKDIRKLSYDFYLPKQNLLIEIQGEQHIRPKNFGGISKEKALKNFILQKKHDLMKLEYAKKHNFNFLEISYKNFDKIKKILKEKIIDKK